MESTRFQFLKQVMSPASDALCGGDDAHQNYVDNAVKLSNYVKAVNTTSPPVLVYPFKEWDEYIKVFGEVKVLAMEWTGEVMYNLIDAPKIIIKRDEDVKELFQSIINNCARLEKDPESEWLRNRVLNDLDYSEENIKYVCSFVTRIIGELDSFSESLKKQVAQLRQISDMSLEQENVDLKQIAELKESIASTKKNIDNLTSSVIALSAGLGICLAVGIGVAFAGPGGLIATGFIAVAALADATVLSLNSAELIASKAKIKQLNTQMDGYTKDAAALGTIADTFADLVVMADDVKRNLIYIHNAWAALSHDLNGIKNEITHAKKHSQALQWSAIAADIQEGLEIWIQFIAKVRILNLDTVTGNTAVLELGMSAEDVKAALDKGQTLDLMDYLTA